MTDIVERLRNHTPSLGYGGCQDCYSLVMDDAADEIERLRARIKKLEGQPRILNSNRNSFM